MKKIDINTWKRKDIFTHFSYGSNPFYNVTFKLDVTNLYNYVKKENLSFYYSLTYLCTMAMNELENFRYSIVDDEVVMIDERCASFTDMKKGEDLFYIVTMPSIHDLKEYNKVAKEKSESQNFFLDYESESHDLIYISCIPNVDITCITNEMDYTNPKFKDDSVPRLSWGKYIEENDRKQLGMSIEVNHRFIDGYHVGLFVQKLEEKINQL